MLNYSKWKLYALSSLNEPFTFSFPFSLFYIVELLMYYFLFWYSHYLHVHAGHSYPLFIHRTFVSVFDLIFSYQTQRESMMLMCGREVSSWRNSCTSSWKDQKILCNTYENIVMFQFSCNVFFIASIPSCGYRWTNIFTSNIYLSCCNKSRWLKLISSYNNCLWFILEQLE